VIPDLSQTSVVVVVFAMHGCPPCDEYLPRLMAAVGKAGAPFVVWSPGQTLSRGQIPVLLYDAASEDPQLSAFADKLAVTSTPSTYVMTRSGTTKIEGSIDDATIDRALAWAQRMNG
jgi:thiol-disulfide isomerase/thioredoxin